MILAGGLLGCIFLLILGLFLGPRMTRIISIPKRLLLPVITVLCVIGAFAGNNRIFDVVIMIIFGVVGYFMRRREYSVAPVTLALVLGSMMDSNFRRAISLAVSEDAFFTALLVRPITLVLLALTIIVIVSNIPGVKRFASSRKMNKRDK
jgi:putative tricarboxylic transport membrane protein